MKSKLLSVLLLISFVSLFNQANAQGNDNLSATKQTINWSEYYPLHVGDFWVYSRIAYWQGIYINFQSKSTIIKDTVMSDGCTYYKRDISYWGGYLSYERIDSLGRIWSWQLNYDTCFAVYGFNISSGEIMDDGTIKVSPGGPTTYFKRGIGVVGYNSGLVHSLSTSFDGAYINSVVYGDTSYSKIGVENEELPPMDYTLDQNYPNPFNPTTNITFQLPKESFVSLVVYNMLGEKVETLLNEYRGIGKHTVTFNAHNLPSGIYFYTLQTQGLTETKKMLFLK